jgi:hypothetical protein
MAGRNRVIGGRKFGLQAGVAGRGKVALPVAAFQGPPGEDGDDGAAGAPGVDGTTLDIVTPGTFDPDDYNVGDVVLFVDALDSPTELTFGGRKGDGGGTDFPDPLPIVT